MRWREITDHHRSVSGNTETQLVTRVIGSTPEFLIEDLWVRSDRESEPDYGYLATRWLRFRTRWRDLLFLNLKKEGRNKVAKRKQQDLINELVSQFEIEMFEVFHAGMVLRTRDSALYTEMLLRTRDSVLTHQNRVPRTWNIQSKDSISIAVKVAVNHCVLRHQEPGWLHSTSVYDSFSCDHRVRGGGLLLVIAYHQKLRQEGLSHWRLISADQSDVPAIRWLWCKLSRSKIGMARLGGAKARNMTKCIASEVETRCPSSYLPSSLLLSPLFHNHATVTLSENINRELLTDWWASLAIISCVIYSSPYFWK